MDLKDFDNFHVAAFLHMAAQQIQDDKETLHLPDSITHEQIYCILGSGITMLRNQLRDNNKEFQKVTKEVANKMKRAYQEQLKKEKLESQEAE